MAAPNGLPGGQPGGIAHETGRNGEPATTKKFYIFGYNISHSLSPTILALQEFTRNAVHVTSSRIEGIDLTTCSIAILRIQHYQLLSDSAALEPCGKNRVRWTCTPLITV